jgi:tetratricopeptide (TPR) repeat protein
MKIISIEIEQFLTQYDQIRELKKEFLQSAKDFIPKHFLLTYLSQLKEGSYHVFRETQRWLIQISTTDYLTYETTFKPVKMLFSNILDQFTSSPTQILSDLKDIVREMFENQKMLNDNKKKFFKMISEILSQEKYSEFYPMLKDYSEFVEELADIESLYYTIKANDSNKVETVRKRVLKIIEKYSRLFLPWFIYANMLAIQEKYHEAINAYLEAIKYDSNQGNFARLYHNLLVAYLSQKKYLPAIDLVKKLDVGIRTYPHIIDLIRKLEQLTHERILND